jgi:hypothetical protein
MKSDNGDCKSIQLPLGMIHFELFQVFENCLCGFILYLIMDSCTKFCLQVNSIICRCVTMFVALKGKKQCCPIGFLF